MIEIPYSIISVINANTCLLQYIDFPRHQGFIAPLQAIHGLSGAKLKSSTKSKVLLRPFSLKRCVENKRRLEWPWQLACSRFRVIVAFARLKITTPCRTWFSLQIKWKLLSVGSQSQKTTYLKGDEEAWGFGTLLLMLSCMYFGALAGFPAGEDWQFKECHNTGKEPPIGLYCAAYAHFVLLIFLHQTCSAKCKTSITPISMTTWSRGSWQESLSSEDLYMWLEIKMYNLKRNAQIRTSRKNT